LTVVSAIPTLRRSPVRRRPRRSKAHPQFGRRQFKGAREKFAAGLAVQSGLIPNKALSGGFVFRHETLRSAFEAIL
jgi:hypothetical protein